ncbi:MAG: hypothetical protein KC609_10135 [Myxococcales bacterium]|nr:hypothetical protein [Myxococcales bacterium]
MARFEPKDHIGFHDDTAYACLLAGRPLHGLTFTQARALAELCKSEYSNKFNLTFRAIPDGDLTEDFNDGEAVYSMFVGELVAVATATEPGDGETQKIDGERLSSALDRIGEFSQGSWKELVRKIGEAEGAEEFLDEEDDIYLVASGAMALARLVTPEGDELEAALDGEPWEVVDPADGTFRLTAHQE